MIAFFPGRFQPFHKGHLHALRRLADKCDFIFIGVGTGKSDRPLNFRQRKAIIEKALAPEGILEKVRVVDVPDVGDDVMWVESVFQRCPGMDIVVTGNPWVRRCFGGILPVAEPAWLNKRIYNGTSIRKLVQRHGKWENRVPAAVVREIRKSLEVKHRAC